MKRNLSIIFLLILASLGLLYFASSEPTETIVTETPSDKPTLAVENTPTLSFMLTNTTLTAEMGLTITAIPSKTPPAWATVIPVVGDLGWGAVYGRIIDGNTLLPIEGASIKCEQFSSTSNYLCNGVTTTNSDGIYSFTPVYFNEADRITLLVEAPGYTPLFFEQSSFALPEFHADLGLFPLTEVTLPPTPFIMCTPPVCSNGDLVCGDSNGCPGGCGTICLPWTATP